LEQVSRHCFEGANLLMRLLASSGHNDTGQYRLLVDVESAAAFVHHFHDTPPAWRWPERGVPFSQTLLCVLPVVQEQHSVVPRDHPRQVFCGLAAPTNFDVLAPRPWAAG